MGAETCLVIGCDRAPDDEVTVDSNGLALVYSACTAHATELRWGATFADRRDDQRGLLGMKPTPRRRA